jgi:acyl-coenzyme A synthetase/AMP-(fatty) acid ligase
MQRCSRADEPFVIFVDKNQREEILTYTQFDEQVNRTEEFPKTSIGKIRKNVIRAEYWERSGKENLTRGDRDARMAIQENARPPTR